MDNFTFEILEEIYEKGTIPYEKEPDTPLLSKKHTSQCYLLKKGYAIKPNSDSMEITIDGAAYVEEQRKNNHLIELQEQNVDIQASLRNCQRLLIILAFLQLLHTLDISLVHIFGSFEWLFNNSTIFKWVTDY